MFPESSCKQQGFLVPLALFIVVGLAALAVAIAYMSAQGSGSSVREAISAQTFYAAESGAQYAMNKIFYPSAQRAAADANCAAVNGQTLNFNAPGLRSCSAVLSCSRSVNASDTISFYTVYSAATCGSGDLGAERTIEVAAYIQ